MFRAYFAGEIPAFAAMWSAETWANQKMASKKWYFYCPTFLAI
jgi:hypothetical protein